MKLIHHYWPEDYDYTSLEPDQTRELLRIFPHTLASQIQYLHLVVTTTTTKPTQSIQHLNTLKLALQNPINV